MKEIVKEEGFCSNLPELLRLYVVHVVKWMAKNLVNWINFLKTVHELKINSVDAIQWTSTGTIDEAKVFAQWFLNHDIAAQNRTAACAAYHMAYRCVEINFLFNHSQNIQDLISKSTVSDPSCITLVSVSPMTTYIQKMYFSDEPKIVSRKVEQEICYLFYTAVLQGCLLTTKFFWNKMTEKNREKACIFTAKKCVELYLNQKSVLKDFLNEQYVKIMIFLMSRMSADQIKKFLKSKKCKILPMVITVWPEVNFFLPLFENVKETLSISEFATILQDITSHFERTGYYNFQFNYSECFYFELFKRAYHSFCKSLKNCSPDNFSTYLTDVIRLLFKICHVPGLRLIYESRLFIDCKYSLSVIREGILETVYDEAGFSVIDLLLRNILNEKNEVEKFKLILQFLNNVISGREYCVLNRFLIFLALQKDEISEECRHGLITSEINLGDLCKILIKNNNFILAENVLDQVLRTEEEKENFKIIFSSEKFVKLKFYSFWAYKGDNDQSAAMHDASCFLKFLFKSEIQQDLFKTEKLIDNSKCIKMFFNEYRFSSTVTSKLQNLEEFIEFCEIDDDKIAEIKKDLRENLLDVINSDEKSDFFVIVCLISWCSENDEQKKEIIKNLMMFIDICSLWDEIKEINVDKSTHLSLLVTFCNEWIKESQDINRLKDEILQGKRKNYDYSNWENVFAKLIRGDDVQMCEIDSNVSDDEENYLNFWDEPSDDDDPSD